MKKKLAFILAILTVFTVAALLAACNDDVETDYALPDRVSIDGSSEMKVGESITLSVIASGGNTYEVIEGWSTYSTADTDIISINGNTVTGLKDGTATVKLQIWYRVMTSYTTCTRGTEIYDSKTYTATKTIVVSETGAAAPPADFTLSLQPSEATLYAWETQQFSVSGFPDGYKGDKSGTWTSNDESVATVDADGLVTAKAQGSCTITFTHTATGKTAEATLTVVAAWMAPQPQPPDPTYTLTPTTPTTPPHIPKPTPTPTPPSQTAPLINGLASGSETREVTYSSTASSITGTVNITGDPTPTVTVSDPTIGTRLSVNGSTYTLDCTGLTPGSYGPFTITATNAAGIATWTINLTVTAPTPTLFALSLQPSEAALYAGETKQFRVSGFPDGYPGENSGTWTSNGEAVATVSANGLVTAKAPGSCTVMFTHTLTGKTASARLTVTPMPAAPLINGSASGGETLSISSYSTSPITGTVNITGYPTPTVTVYDYTGDGRLSVNGSTYTLNCSGFPPGSHGPFTITATNAAGSATWTIYLTVAP
jgi:hypothetical protein